MKPFNYGKVADDSYFTNRQNEREWLKRQIDSGINTMLISPRRWGKSSLVNRVAADYKKKDTVFCFIDLFNIRNEKEFYEELSRQVMKSAAGSMEELTKLATGFFKKLLPAFSFSPDPSLDVSISLNWNEAKKHYTEILDLPERIAIKKNIHLVLCIDEFQNLSHFDDPIAVQKRLRAHWQKHKNVTYLLYGSKRHLLMDFFTKPSMPFYKFGEILFLNKIEEKYWIPYIMERFHATGKSINESLAQYIARKMTNHPYFVQQLAQATWYNTNKKCKPDDVDNAIDDLINQYNILYQKEIEQLTNLQLNFLKGLCNGETAFTSNAFLKTYEIGPAANIKRIKEALENKEIIDIEGKNISFNDPMFAIWLKKKYFIV